MAIWSTLKGELDKAGRAAQGALDEGRLRLEQHRAKQRAEAAAASLGFAVYRAAPRAASWKPSAIQCSLRRSPAPKRKWSGSSARSPHARRAPRRHLPSEL